MIRGRRDGDEGREKARFEALLRRELSGLIEPSGHQLGELWQHYAMLRRWRTRVNLISDTRLEDIVHKHYCESLFLAARLPQGKLSLADVGAGAGFPGIPVAVFRPDCHVTLIESRARKVVFLQEVTRNLPNVTVAHCRAENLSLEFDWLISRAVAWDEISQLVPRLSRRVGLIVSRDTAHRLVNIGTMRWEKPIGIPWRRAAVVLFGTFHVEHQESDLTR